MEKSAQRGGSTASILIILAGAGIIFFLILVNALDFKDKLFSALYPKPKSFASTTDNEVKFSKIQAQAASSSATITWETNIPSTSKILVGQFKDVLSLSTMEDNTLAVVHQVTITGLALKTTYYYQVISRNASGQEFSSDVKQLETAQN